MVEPVAVSTILFRCDMNHHQTLWEHKKIKILSQLLPEELENLRAHSLDIQRERGELVTLQSDVPRVYILDKGYIRFYRITEEGRRMVTGFLGPADLFGSLFSDDTAPYGDEFIEVVRQARFIAIETRVFKNILQRYPAFLMRMIEILEKHKNDLEQRVHSLMRKDIHAQTAELLLALSAKFSEGCVDEPDVARDIMLTHQEIADLAGLARPTVSKIISEFLKLELLRKHQHHLCIYNHQALQEIAKNGFSNAVS